MDKTKNHIAFNRPLHYGYEEM